MGVSIAIVNCVVKDAVNVYSIPEEDGQGQKVLIIKLHPEDFN